MTRRSAVVRLRGGSKGGGGRSLSQGGSGFYLVNLMKVWPEMPFLGGLCKKIVRLAIPCKTVHSQFYPQEFVNSLLKLLRGMELSSLVTLKQN